jgi:hypothetical protein
MTALELPTSAHQICYFPGEGRLYPVGIAGDGIQAQLGTVVQGRIRRVAMDQVLLELALQTSELDHANDKEMLLAGQSYRLTQRIRPGEGTRMVLKKDDTGAPLQWLEVRVSPLPAESPAEPTP